jgi:hypothetical protein
MAISQNTPRANTRGSNTAQSNYSSISFGQKDASISFGHIAKSGDVIHDVKLQAEDGRHQFTLDKNGIRKGWTSSTSPGNFQVLCGMDTPGDKDSMVLCAQNGNIVIRAMNGRIRLEALDIDIIASGNPPDRGNILVKAHDGIKLDCKNLNMAATNSWKLMTTGMGEITANTTMKMYSSMIRGVTDAVKNKDSKLGGQDYLKQELEEEWGIVV